MARYLLNVMSTYEVDAADDNEAYECFVSDGRLIDEDVLIVDVIAEGS